MISERKFQILAHCNIVPSSPKVTAEAMGVEPKSLSTTMIRMAEDGLLEVVDGLYLTTPVGRIEARLFKDAAARVVPAPRIDKFAGHYSPSSSYQRNAGLKHIPSRGFPC